MRRPKNRLIAAIVALVMCLGVGGSLAAPIKHPEIHRAINIRTDMWTRLAQERAARNLPPLVWNGRLSERGAGWSARMAKAGKIFHSDLNFPPRVGKYDFIGEAVGSGSAGVDSGAMHLGFMESTPHRDLYLNTGFTSAGIGVYCALNHSLWVTILFGRRVREGPPPPSYRNTTPLWPVMRADPSDFTC